MAELEQRSVLEKSENDQLFARLEQLMAEQQDREQLKAQLILEQQEKEQLRSKLEQLLTEEQETRARMR